MIHAQLLDLDQLDKVKEPPSKRRSREREER